MRARNWSILFLWLVVLFFFFAGFYGFIVPSNKASVNKYGFHILEQLETAIQNKIDADLDTYANNLDTLYNATDTIVPQWVKQRLIGMGVEKAASGRNPEAVPGTSALAAARADSLQTMDTAAPRKGKKSERPVIARWLADIANGRLIYSFKLKHQTVILTQPLSRLMDELAQSYPANFYSAFIFLKCESGTATTQYISDGVPLGLKITTDSLLVNSKGAFYPGISDLYTGGQNFKLFYIPLTRGKLQFSLCGVKDADAYNQSIRQLPANFVYPIVILLLLLAISLPLIKFYTIGPTEAIRVRDLWGVAFSLLGGGMLITLTVIQLVLLKDSNARQQVSLGRLSRDLDGNLNQELQKAFRQLQAIDQERAADPANWRPAKAKTNYYDVTPNLLAYMQRQDSGYYSFDRIDWVDSAGTQAVTGSLDTTQDELHVDVSTRQYFTDFLNNTAYRLSETDTAVVSVRAVITWSDGDFRVILARRSSCPGALIVTLSTKLYSVNHTVLPSGFGFCIIDAAGKVQLHSEPGRNLVENFLDQSEESDQLRAAMTGRQELYLEDANLYGRTYGLHLSPIGNMPYYLAVFYDKGYILPINMRILVFSFIGCGVNLAACLLVWLVWVVVIRKRWTARPILYGPMDYLPYLRPDRTKVPVYIRSALVLFLYILILVVTAVFNPYDPGINKGVLVQLLLLPLLAFGVLFLFWWLWRSWVANPKSESERADCDEGKGRYSYLRYLVSYALLTETLIVCLGVGPAALWSWHAQNQEILQSVKREQLLTADQLISRRPSLYQSLSHLPAALPGDSLYYWWIDHAGIYSVYPETHERTRGENVVAAKPFIFERAYFSLAQRFGKINYDPSYVPVLRNQSADGHWKWMELEGDVLPFFFTEDPDLHQAGVGDSGRTAKTIPPFQTVIYSSLPERYPYLGFFWKSFFLGVFILLLVLGLYGLIRRIAKEVFLLRWTRGGPGFNAKDASADKDSSGRNLMPQLPYAAEYTASLKEPVDPVAKSQGVQSLLIRLNSIDTSWRGSFYHEGLDEAERMVVRGARVGEPYFKWLFTTCLTDKEQWLLYNFACHGLLNYKNVLEIDHLLEAGILDARDGQVRIFNPAFRAYLLMNWREDLLPKGVMGKSAWQRFRIPFLILLTLVAAFLFLTQQEAWQRVTALVGALGSALGAVLGLLKNFDSPGGDGSK